MILIYMKEFPEVRRRRHDSTRTGQDNTRYLHYGKGHLSALHLQLRHSTHRVLPDDFHIIRRFCYRNKYPKLHFALQCILQYN